MSVATPQQVLSFWFDETSPAQHFKKDAKFDALIHRRFGALHAAALAGELEGWRDDIHGRLAEIIVLDQFSRNIHRGQAQAFAADAMALTLAQHAVCTDCAGTLVPTRRTFLYMPFMHSESRVIHAQAVALFSEPGLERSLEFEHQHKRIIDEFGRYPHRNKALGRVSTAAEKAFLAQPHSSF